MRSGTPVAGFFASLVSNSCTEIGEVALEIVIVPMGEFQAFKRFPDEEIFHVQRFDHFPRVFLKSLNLSKATHYLSPRYTTGQGITGHRIIKLWTPRRNISGIKI